MAKIAKVVRDALRLSTARTDEDARKLERLDRLIQEGLDDVEAGRFEEVKDIGGWLDGIEAEIAAKHGRRRQPT